MDWIEIVKRNQCSALFDTYEDAEISLNENKNNRLIDHCLDGGYWADVAKYRLENMDC